MVAEYIEREDALKKLNKNSITKKITLADGVSIYDTIKNIPTVDAVEFKHGEWIIKDDDYDCEMMCCSICKSEFYDGDNDTVDHLHNYCPNCGAKMDLKEGAEE